MESHAPANYHCPFCLLLQGVENSHVESRTSDIFYKDNVITAFIASRWYMNNPGHVLIIPNEHIENIYNMTESLSDRIHRFEIEVAKALKEVYQCDGVSSRQHNEPAGDQDVWHYHQHVFPRYTNDNLYKAMSNPTTVEQRMSYSDKLKAYFMGKSNLYV